MVLTAEAPQNTGLGVFTAPARTHRSHVTPLSLPSSPWTGCEDHKMLLRMSCSLLGIAALLHGILRDMAILTALWRPDQKRQGLLRPKRCHIGLDSNRMLHDTEAHKNHFSPNQQAPPCGRRIRHLSPASLAFSSCFQESATLVVLGV